MLSLIFNHFQNQKTAISCNVIIACFNLSCSLGIEQEQTQGRESWQVENHFDVERRLRGSNLRHRTRKGTILQIQMSRYKVRNLQVKILFTSLTRMVRSVSRFDYWPLVLYISLKDLESFQFIHWTTEHFIHSSSRTKSFPSNLI